MSWTLNLTIWNSLLWPVVQKSKRSQVNEWIIEHQTVNWSIRTQYMYKKYIYEFECFWTVNTLETLISELWYDPVKVVKYNKTWWNTWWDWITCLIKIEDESYDNFLSQPQDAFSWDLFVEFKLTCKEI